MTRQQKSLYNKQYWMRQKDERNLLRNNRGTHGEYHGPLVACCGRWWPIQCVPFICPTCRTIYFEKAHAECLTGGGPESGSPGKNGVTKALMRRFNKDRPRIAIEIGPTEVE